MTGRGKINSNVGRGVAAKGMICITVGGDGLVETVELDPRVRRLDVENLAEQIHTAVLAAQKDWLNKRSTAVNAALKANAEELKKKLAENHAEYIRQMDVYHNTIR